MDGEATKIETSGEGRRHKGESKENQWREGEAGTRDDEGTDRQGQEENTVQKRKSEWRVEERKDREGKRRCM